MQLRLLLSLFLIISYSISAMQQQLIGHDPNGFPIFLTPDAYGLMRPTVYVPVVPYLYQQPYCAPVQEQMDMAVAAATQAPSVPPAVAADNGIVETGIVDASHDDGVATIATQLSGMTLSDADDTQKTNSNQSDDDFPTQLIVRERSHSCPPALLEPAWGITRQKITEKRELQPQSHHSDDPKHDCDDESAGTVTVSMQSSTPVQSSVSTPAQSPTPVQSVSLSTQSFAPVVLATPKKLRHDERLQHELAHSEETSYGTLTHALHCQIDWIKTRKNDALRRQEWLKLHSLCEQAPFVQKEHVVTDAQACALFELGNALINKAKTIEPAGRNKLMYLARDCVVRAKQSQRLPDNLQEKYKQILEQANEMLPRSRKGGIDQSYLTEAEFYGPVAAPVKARAGAVDAAGNAGDSKKTTKKPQKKVTAAQSAVKKVAPNKETKKASNEIKKAEVIQQAKHQNKKKPSSVPAPPKRKESKAPSTEFAKAEAEIKKEAAVLATHTNEKGLEPDRDREACLMAVDNYMKDEQYHAAALQAFCTLQDRVGVMGSIGHCADLLPGKFFDRMYKYADRWAQEVMQDGEESTMSKADKAQWLGVIGRMVTQGTHARFAKHKHRAIGWIKAAADCGDWHAIVLMSQQDDAVINARRRMLYLERILNNLDQRSELEQAEVKKLFTDFLPQGFLFPLARYISGMYRGGQMPKLVESLEGEFPPLQIGRHDGEAYRMLKQSGAFDALKKAGKESWAAMAAAVALEIAYIRDNDAVKQDDVSAKKALVMMAVATGILAKLIQKYPERAAVLDPILAAGYATVADVSIATAIKDEPDDTKKKAIVQKSEQGFKQAIAMGNDYAKYTYAHVLLRLPQLVAEKNPRKVAIEYLQELAEKESDYTQKALDDLALYLRKEKHPQAKKYLEQAHKRACDTYALSDKRKSNYEYVQDWLKNRVRDKRLVAQPTEKERYLQEERALRNAQLVTRTRSAVQKLRVANECARTNPTQALEAMLQATLAGINLILPENPQLIVEYYMAIDLVRKAAEDKDITKSEAEKFEILRQLMPFELHVQQAEVAYKFAIAQPNYKPINPNHMPPQLEAVCRDYLVARFRRRIIHEIAAIKNQDEQRAKIHKFINEMQVPDRFLVADEDNRLTVLALAVDMALDQAGKRYLAIPSGQKGRAFINLEVDPDDQTKK